MTGRNRSFNRLGLTLVLAAFVAAVGCCADGTQDCGEEKQTQKTTRDFFATPLGEVHFVDTVAGDGPPVVLLHQTPRSVDEFREVIPLLAARHRVIAIDNPGYGCSDVPPRQPTVEEYADSVVSLLDHLGIPVAHLAGHHTCAILAVDIAAGYPDRVATLGLTGPHFMDAEMRELLHKISVQWRVQEDGSHMMEMWEEFYGWTPDPAVIHRVVTDLLRAGENSEYGHFTCAEYLMENALPLVKAPALLIVGRNDIITNSLKNAVFAETMPDTEQVEIEGGIFLPTESPEPFAEAVLANLEERE